MISQDYRPKTFDEIVGQELNNKIFKSILVNPEEAPRSIILFGGYGLGKTSWLGCLQGQSIVWSILLVLSLVINVIIVSMILRHPPFMSSTTLL